MKQILIRNKNLLSSGIYFIQGSIKEVSIPTPLLTLPYNDSDKKTFIINRKPELKYIVKKAGYPDVFVAYWFIDNGKAIVYICPEKGLVNEWYKYLLKHGFLKK